MEVQGHTRVAALIGVHVFWRVHVGVFSRVSPVSACGCSLVCSIAHFVLENGVHLITFRGHRVKVCYKLQLPSGKMCLNACTPIAYQTVSDNHQPQEPTKSPETPSYKSAPNPKGREGLERYDNLLPQSHEGAFCTSSFSGPTL